MESACVVQRIHAECAVVVLQRRGLRRHLSVGVRRRACLLPALAVTGQTGPVVSFSACVCLRPPFSRSYVRQIVSTLCHGPRRLGLCFEVWPRSWRLDCAVPRGKWRPMRREGAIAAQRARLER